MNLKYIALVLLTLLSISPVVQAGCDPCKCGPGGDYKGDLNQWFRDNCPNQKPKSVLILINFGNKESNQEIIKN